MAASTVAAMSATIGCMTSVKPAVGVVTSAVLGGAMVVPMIVRRMGAVGGSSVAVVLEGTMRERSARLHGDRIQVGGAIIAGVGAPLHPTQTVT